MSQSLSGSTMDTNGGDRHQRRGFEPRPGWCAACGSGQVTTTPVVQYWAGYRHHAVSTTAEPASPAHREEAVVELFDVHDGQPPHQRRCLPNQCVVRLIACRRTRADDGHQPRWRERRLTTVCSVLQLPDVPPGSMGVQGNMGSHRGRVRLRVSGRARVRGRNSGLISGLSQVKGAAYWLVSAEGAE